MKPKSTKAVIESITPLTDSILQLVLIPKDYIPYEAGQYLQILTGDETLSYSIANAPLGSHKYELHLRHHPNNPAINSLLKEIKDFGEVTIQLPLGECHINRLELKKPILFIAGGTGFAPIKSMIEQLLVSHQRPHFELYWGARSQSDLYMDERVQSWQSHVQNFQYFSLLSEESKETLSSLVLSRHNSDLNQWQTIISGPFDMVYAMRDMLMQNGAESNNLFSDAFSFESK